MNKRQPALKNTNTDSNIQAGRDVHLGDVTYIVEGKNVVVPRHLTNNIPTNVEHLIGRMDELKTIGEHLAHNRPTVLVNGIGGIGKTSVATKFMAIRGHEYKHLAWLTLAGSLAETFVNHTVLKESLHISQEVRELVEARNIADAFALVFKKLNELDSTLVVIDNANELDDLLEHKHLFDHCTCHVLVTSRSSPQEWTAVVPVEAMPPAEAVHLFKKLAALNDPKATNEAIENLLSKLYFHALLIELLAKAVASAGLGFRELVDMIETRFIHHEALREELVPTGRHGDSLPENAKRANIEDYIWLIFSQVKGLDDKSKDILRCMALLPLAMQISREDLKEHLAIWNIENIAPALTMLVERGWLDKVQAPGQKPKYKMHPLIADVVVRHLEVGAEFAEEYVKRAAEMIHYDNIDPEHNLFEKNKFKPLAERLINLFWDENREEMSNLLDNLGTLEEYFIFYHKAVVYMERALENTEMIFDQNHAFVSKRQSNLANVYGNLGRNEEASRLLETALKSDLSRYGHNHPIVATRQSNLAMIYQNLGRNEEAAKLMETALKSDLDNFHNDHPQVALLQSNLAMLYRDLGRNEEAAELMEIALKSDLNNFGIDHPTVAISQSNLALVYCDLSRNEEAVGLMETALKSDLNNFGKDHRKVAIRKYNLGILYIKTNRKTDARVLLEDAYQHFVQNFGEMHPNTIKIQTWLLDTL